MIGSRMVLSYIRQVNRVNFCNDFDMKTAPLTFYWVLLLIVCRYFRRTKQQMSGIHVFIYLRAQLETLIVVLKL